MKWKNIEWNCIEEKCEGKVTNEFEGIPLKLKSQSEIITQGFPCNVCGRLYYINRKPAFSNGKKLFLINGYLVEK